LPAEVRDLADKNFRLWIENPQHPSLQYKPLKKDLWSVRIGSHYRALAHVDGDDVLWVWIGHHSEYDHLIA
jgi:hypothetical protein